MTPMYKLTSKILSEKSIKTLEVISSKVKLNYLELSILWTLKNVVWTKRSENPYVGITLPKTTEEIIESLKNNSELNFYKSLDIDNINAEILALHPSVYAF